MIQVIVGWSNGLSPVRRHAITWHNTDLLSVTSTERNFGEIWHNTSIFSEKKMGLKCVDNARLSASVQCRSDYYVVYNVAHHLFIYALQFTSCINTLWRHVATQTWAILSNGLLADGKVDLLGEMPYGIPRRVISQEAFMNLIRHMCSEIILLKLPPHRPGAKELKEITFSWQALHCSSTGDPTSCNGLQTFVTFWINGVTYTPGGLAYGGQQWGTNRYAGNGHIKQGSDERLVKHPFKLIVA